MADLKTVHLDLPARTEDLRKLEIGSVAYLTGRVFTAREGVYKRAIADGVGMPAGKDALGITNFHCSPAASDQSRRQLYRRRGHRDGVVPLRPMARRLVQNLRLQHHHRQRRHDVGDLSRAFRSQQRGLSHHRRLRHRRAARPRHQAGRRRLLAGGTRPRAGGLGARRRKIRPVPGRERSCRQSACSSARTPRSRPASTQLYAGTRPATLRRYGETDDKTKEVI